MKKQTITTISVGLMALGLASIADAALVGRLAASPGGTDYQAYYDEDADLTWLADANAAGAMNWVDANNWAANLDIDGVTGWRLPTTLNPDASCSTPSNSTGFNCTGSEMGHLSNVVGISAGIPGQFSNVLSADYWSATEFAPNPNSAWSFNMGFGVQNAFNKSTNLFAWAVQSGDVSAVPVPAAVWLFGSGLLAMLGLARRKTSTL